jgi:hypothetical protein
MHRSARKIRVRATKHYVKFRLVDEQTRDEEEMRENPLWRHIDTFPPLLAWVARARLLASVMR